jgi:UDP-galactopyranose mutase
MKNNFNYLIVGAGFFGAICASELTKAGQRCLVVDRRSHIGGNCYTERRDGINIHIYGPHIFHTSNERVWRWINQYATFNNFRLMPVANYRGEIYSLPFNMWTFNQLWGVKTPEEARQIIERQAADVLEPSNLEEQAIKSVGRDVYEKLIKGYTTKQWMRSPDTLPKEIIKRLPVRFTYDSNYFNDQYQGIPVGGYTPIFEKLLDGIEVRLGVDFLKSRNELLTLADKVIYTGPIDEYFDYQFGELEYKTTSFDHQRLETDNYQGTPMMNYTDVEIPFTRIIEHKHFESAKSPVSWVTWEYPKKYHAGQTEPYYPVNDEPNNSKYRKYFELSQSEENVLFGGRLADYKYYDMHNVIEKALDFVDQLSDGRSQ